jgi:hypothetical protein
MKIPTARKIQSQVIKSPNQLKRNKVMDNSSL